MAGGRDTDGPGNIDAGATAVTEELEYPRLDERGRREDDQYGDIGNDRYVHCNIDSDYRKVHYPYL